MCLTVRCSDCTDLDSASRLTADTVARCRVSDDDTSVFTSPQTNPNMSVHTEDISGSEVAVFVIFWNRNFLCPCSPAFLSKCFCCFGRVHHISFFSALGIHSVVDDPTEISWAICSGVVILVPRTIRIIAGFWILILCVSVLFTIGVVFILELIEIDPRVRDADMGRLHS